MKLALLAIAVAVALGIAWLIVAPRQNDRWAVGEIYSIRNADGGFRVAKVLALDPGIVSIRVYKQQFSARPEMVEPSQLDVGTIHDTDGFGIGHMPLAFSTFASWEPRFISHAEVGENELDGYHLWKENEGGIFQ